jgi:hypothetical protein
MKISGTEVSQTSAQGRSIVDETIRPLNIFHPVPDDRVGDGRKMAILTKQRGLCNLPGRPDR